MFSTSHYILLNKNKLLLAFEARRNALGEVSFHIEQSYSNQRPFGCDDIHDWIENRRAPKHREHIENILRMSGCLDAEGYLQVAHALSLNDTFWVKPADSRLTWEKVSLFRNPFDEVIAHLAFEGGMYGEQLSSTSPEYSTDGTYAKCWVRDSQGIYLVKSGTTGAKNAGLEPYSEKYACQLAEVLCPEAVPYSTEKFRGRLVSRCPLFTTEQAGFAPAYRFVGKHAQLADLQEYFYQIGSEDAFARMLVLDALTINTDRHLGNFGVLFDTDTLQVIGMAPVFDNNQALLPYAEPSDFAVLKQYLWSRPCRIGEDFNVTANHVMTPAIRADLMNLRGFSFEETGLYNLPKERLSSLDRLVSLQIDNLLHQIRLYTPPTPQAKDLKRFYGNPQEYAREDMEIDGQNPGDNTDNLNRDGQLPTTEVTGL